ETIPAFLWIDEAQYFANGQDMFFLPTARSHFASTVMITQNLPNFFATIGGNNSHDRVNSILGNLGVKIFHANDCPVTNSYAANVIGMTFQEKDSINFSAGGSGGSVTEQMHYQVQPHEFTTLRTGGPLNDYKVDAFISCAGKVFSNEKNFM